MSHNFPKLTLVLGGARSGKSAFSEQLAMRSGLRKTYVATAQAFDDEMAKRIRDHQVSRGDGWHTIEAPLDLATTLEKVQANDIVLIDCLTLWLSNLMLQNLDIETETAAFLSVLESAKTPVICVSNEVGMGLVPDNAMGRAFRDAQGVLNRQVAAQADLAVFVAAGLPLVLKGNLPEDKI